MTETKTFNEEVRTQRYILKDQMRRARANMLDALPKLAENAKETESRIKDFSGPESYCGNPDMHKWLQTYTDIICEANREWFEASEKMKILDAIEEARKNDEKNLFKR